MHLTCCLHVFSPVLGVFKNKANTQVVSHAELKGILTEFQHSVIGSVKASMLDAMKLQKQEKERNKPPVLKAQISSASSRYNPMVSDTESDMEESDDSGSDIEAW